MHLYENDKPARFLEFWRSYDEMYQTHKIDKKEIQKEWKLLQKIKLNKKQTHKGRKCLMFILLYNYVPSSITLNISNSLHYYNDFKAA